MKALHYFIFIVFLTVLPLITEIALYPTPKTHAACVQKAKLAASDGAAGDYFGISVSICGDTVVVGADRDYIGTKTTKVQRISLKERPLETQLGGPCRVCCCFCLVVD